MLKGRVAGGLPGYFYAVSAPFRFRNFTLRQDHSSFKATSDAVLFGAWIRLPHPEGFLMDLGTGTGLLACLMRIRYPSLRIYGIEVDAHTCLDTRKNYRSVGIPESQLATADFLQTWPAEWPSDWDYLISNPPFFINDLPNKKASLAQARHFTMHQAEVFVMLLASKLKPEGRVYLMLPQRNFEWYRTALDTRGLYLQRLCQVRGTQNKPAHLVFAEFARTFVPVIQEENMAMYDSDGTPSTAYRLLVKEYYEEGYFERFKLSARRM